MTDAELMQRVKEGDEAAFRKIVDTYQDSIYSLCSQYLGNHQDAEEIAQDVFIKLYKNAENYEPRAKLSTFLYRIAVNLSLNRIRDRKRKRLVSLDFLRTAKGGMESRSEDRPDVILEREEKAGVVQKAIDSLPDKQRTAVILKRYHHLSYKEIAGVMHCSVAAVESRLFRARQSLQEKLSEFSQE